MNRTGDQISNIPAARQLIFFIMGCFSIIGEWEGWADGAGQAPLPEQEVLRICPANSFLAEITSNFCMTVSKTTKVPLVDARL